MPIILQGDKAKAATWVPWAKNQLQRLKSISSVVNQIYRPAGGVGIHVRSGAGIDRIRIVTAEAGCETRFSQVEPPPRVIPGYTGAFNVRHLVNGKLKRPLSGPPFDWPRLMALITIEGGNASGDILASNSVILASYPVQGDYTTTIYTFIQTGASIGDVGIRTPTNTTFTVNPNNRTRFAGFASIAVNNVPASNIVVKINGDDPDPGMIYIQPLELVLFGFQTIVIFFSSLPGNLSGDPLTITFDYDADEGDFTTTGGMQLFPYTCISKKKKVITIPFTT